MSSPAAWCFKAHPGRGGTSCTFWPPRSAEDRKRNTQKVKWNPCRDGLLAPQNAATTQNPLADLGQLSHLLLVLAVEAAAQRFVRRVAGLFSPLPQLGHVLLVAGVDESTVQLDQHRLQGDSQLQGRLSQSAGVEVGASAE